MPSAFLITYLLWIAFWLLAVLVVYASHRRSRAAAAPASGMGAWWPLLAAQWKPAFVVAAVFFAAALIAGLPRGIFSALLGAALGAALHFCQALVGFALARSIVGFEPLPVSRSVSERRGVARTVLLTLLLALAAGVAALFVGSLSQSIMLGITGETNPTQGVVTQMGEVKWLAFFNFLAGAGIAEETPYRLVLVSLFWKLLGRRWPAIVLAALAFAAYHLSPLNTLYDRWWQFPLTMFVSTALVGVVWGYLFTRRGYEAAVTAHTLQNWLVILLFA